MQSAYGVKGAIAKDRDGYGVRVAIIDAYASPTMRQDANRYSRDNGLPTFKKGQYQEKTFRPFNLQSACGGEAGWNVEETLDVESVHSMAPGANILYVGAKNCDTGIDGALNYVVQQRAADMVSNSYGNLGEAVPASKINVEHSIFVQAGAEGIGMYFSSGDSGDEFANTGVTQPDYPASDPKVTAVGGTSLAVNAAGGYQFETGWGSSIDFVNSTGDGYDAPPPGDFAFGAGGGASTIFKQPDYQRGVVPANLSHRGSGPAMRVSPDVAANADPYTGFLVGQTSGGVYSTFAIGGTSLACPLFTGVQALVSQGLSHRIGFANPVLYGLHGSSAYHDVVPPAAATAISNPSGTYLLTFDHDSSLDTAYGYDNVTGNGSPNSTMFLTKETAAAKR